MSASLKLKNYILSHLDKYVVDVHGNFFNINPEFLGKGENSAYAYIGTSAFTPEEIKEIYGKMGEMILREIKDWELVFDEVGNVIHYLHKESGRQTHVRGLELDFEIYYRIRGELGYRENIWKYYEETIKVWDEREKWFRENLTNNTSNTQSTPPKTEPENKSKKQQFNQNPTPPSENNPTQPPNPEKETNIPSQPNQNNPSSPNQNKPTSHLPSPTDTQNQYNSDKDKSEIDNNPNLTDTKEKQKAQEILKVIISAELLVKESKFNQEILTKLIAEKDKNSSLYQMLNKEKRIDKAISQLEDIEKKNNNSNSVVNSQKKNKNSFPTEIILIPFGLSLIVGIGIIVFRRKEKKKRIKLSKKKKV